ncbi:MAG: PrsW family intramembrane metalloprotease [Armatimonadota bacterium]|nr:PrsW family intramembrane metalloprotease [Armatimonadota bacterium]MDR7421574.1 PrsW family intramembrane metalloprotease [Armatimonadota bacterium]MDR7454620.1 PrsW family intramembrane metalloprotease [Armatimonadota bacterium]MDR7455983.1 PrsW family intramembrane metalloprotease [Armatimonadota bacterium]MDR7495980.1 PrsW family intramembrane metalloprotease [Armatimonadota bacterium]
MSQSRGSALPEIALPKGDISDRGLRYLIIGGFGLLFFLFGTATLLYFLARVPFGALVVSTVAAVLPVPLYGALILWLDRHEKEPALLLAAAFFWGAVVATLVSLFLNTGATVVINAILGPRWAGALGASMVAPIVEETSKGAALLLLFFLARHEFNNVVDGIVYGSLVGLGFAMTENILYFSRAHAAGGLAGVGILFLMRVVLSGFNHSLFTGVIGAGLGYAREAPGTVVKVAAPVAGYVAGIMLHALWNGTAVLLNITGIRVAPVVQLLVIVPGMALVLALPGLATLVWLAAAGWRREVRIINEFLKDEVKRRVVTEDELETLGSPRRRFGRLMRALTQQGPQAWLGLRQLYELQVDLAFRKWHASRGERLMSFQQVMTDDGYRERIAQIRERLAAMGVETA